jgi:hypothetical protein
MSFIFPPPFALLLFPSPPATFHSSPFVSIQSVHFFLSFHSFHFFLFACSVSCAPFACPDCRLAFSRRLTALETCLPQVTAEAWAGSVSTHVWRRQVKSAVQQLKKLLQEATLESDDNKRPLFSKYTV